MAYDFDAFLKKKGIKGDEYGVNIVNDETANSYDFDSVLDKIDSKAAGEQGYSLPEYRELQKKSQEAYDRNKGIKKEKRFGDYAEDVVRGVANQPALRAFSRGTTAGFGEPIAAGISSLIQKGMGDERDLGDIYKNIASQQRDESRKIASENPIQNLLGEFAGIAAPGGAFSRIYGAAGKAAGSIPGLASKELSLLGKIAKAGIKGGAANTAFGALETTGKKANLEDAQYHPLRDMALGSGGEILIGMPTEWGINTLANSKTARRLVESVPVLGKYLKGGREELEKQAQDKFANLMSEYNAAESAKKAKLGTAYENSKQAYSVAEEERILKAEAEAALKKRDAIEDLKSLVKKDPAESAQQFFSKIRKADLKIGKDYGETVDPIMEKYRLRKVDTTPFRNEVDNILDRFGVIDENGKVDLKSMEGFIDLDPDAKGLVSKLVSFKEGLKGEVPISKLERGVKVLQKAAQFNKGVGYRSPTEETLGELSKKLKDFMVDQISMHATPEEIAVIQAAKSTYATAKKILKEPLKLIGRFGERPERITRNLSSQLPISTMEDLTKIDPSLKDEFADLFLNYLTGKNRSPAGITNEIDYYGNAAGLKRPRDALKELLGGERFSQLEGKEKALHEASMPWKKNYKPLPPPMKPEYIPEPPPQLEEVPMQKIYETLAKWAKMPDVAKEKLGAQSMPPLTSLFAPFISQILNGRN